MKDNVIAIDGPAASGKSTIAKLVAKKLKAFYISTGNMYRAIALAVLENNIDAKTATEKDFKKIIDSTNIDLKKESEEKLVMIMNSSSVNEAIRKPNVSEIVSYVAKSPAVRNWLLKKQRSFTAFGTIVMEGRDIGTVVFPNATHKFFLTASPEVRAKRRLLQDNENPSAATIESVAKAIAERDKIDSTRKLAPLKKSEDAILVDSSNMTIAEVVDFIVSKVLKKS